jgi:starch synthase
MDSVSSSIISLDLVLIAWGTGRKNMRIAFYTRPQYLDTAFPLIEALCELIEVHMILEVSPESVDASPLELRLKNLAPGVVNLTGKPEEVLGIPLLRFARRLSGFYLVVHDTMRAFDPRSCTVWLRAIKLIRKLSPDILHFDDISSRSAPLFFMTKGANIVSSIHDVEMHSGENIGRANLVRHLLLRRSGAIIFRSHHSQETAVRNKRTLLTGKVVGVIPLGVLEIFRQWEESKIPERQNTILLFGRLSPYKGIGVFLDAVERVAASYWNLRVVIAGKPVSGFKLPKIPMLEKGGRIILRDRHIPNVELCKLFQEASIVVVPYSDASQSGVIATAYGFRKPVVATTVGGLPEMVEDHATGRLVPPENPLALAQALIELLENPEERIRMRRNIERKAKNDLAWPILSQAVLRIYCQLLSGNGTKEGRSHCDYV